MRWLPDAGRSRYTGEVCQAYDGAAYGEGDDCGELGGPGESVELVAAEQPERNGCDSAGEEGREGGAGES